MRDHELELDTILHWLSSDDHTRYQNDIISQRQEGTVQWLLDSAEFKDWKSRPKQTLFCPGIPGAGKTIATSVAIHTICQAFINDDSVGVAYVYCNFKRQEREGAVNLLCCLLKELLRQSDSVPQSIKEIYRARQKHKEQASLHDAKDMLETVISRFSRVFIAVDALDELRERAGRDDLLRALFQVQEKTGLNFFATSRPIPKISGQFDKSVDLEIRAAVEDVRRYIDGHKYLLPAFVLKNAGLQQAISDQIVETVDGM